MTKTQPSEDKSDQSDRIYWLNSILGTKSAEFDQNESWSKINRQFDDDGEMNDGGDYRTDLSLEVICSSGRACFVLVVLETPLFFDWP